MVSGDDDPRRGRLDLTSTAPADVAAGTAKLSRFLSAARMGSSGGRGGPGRAVQRKGGVVRKLVGLGVVLVVLATGATACGGNDNEPAGGGGSGSAAAPTVQTIQPGVLTIGSCLDYKPFETVQPGSTRPTGFDIEVAEAVAAKMGFAPADEKVKWVKTNFNTIFTAVNQNKFDVVAAAVTATGKTGKERAQTVDFSEPYFNSTQGFTVNTEQTPDVTSTDQLQSGNVVGVQQGTTGEQWAKENLATKGVDIKTYVAAPQAFTDLEAGNIDGVINDAPSSASEVESRPSLQVVQQIDTNEKYAFAFAKGNTQLLDAWNQAMKQVFDDGEYATIFQKYFPGVPVPTEFGGS
jgi:ABC-type amino acid transport substrate-binding protein